MRKGMTVAAAVLLLATGCQKLNFSTTVKDVGPREARQLKFDAPAYAQSVRATIDPEKCSVSAYLVKASDADEVEKILDSNREPDSRLVLAGKTFKPNDS